MTKLFSATNPRFPHIKVRLVGEDGNAFAILGRVMKAMRRAKLDDAIVKEFSAQATGGDYEQLLHTVLCWVSEEHPDDDDSDLDD